MKRIISFAAVMLSLIIVTSCGDPPTASKYVIDVTINGQPSSFASLGDAPGVDIYCASGESGCQEAADYYGGAYDNVRIHYMENMLNTLYSYYAADDMATFYQNYTTDFRTTFPQIDNERPGAIDSAKNGVYKIVVTGDSSVLILKDPAQSHPINKNNIVFVIDRDERVLQ